MTLRCLCPYLFVLFVSRHYSQQRILGTVMVACTLSKPAIRLMWRGKAMSIYCPYNKRNLKPRRQSGLYRSAATVLAGGYYQPLQTLICQQMEQLLAQDKTATNDDEHDKTIGPKYAG